MSGVGEFKKPFVTVLDLILLAFTHVALNAIDTTGNQQTDQLILQTEQQVFEVGGLDNVQVKQLVAFTQALHPALAS